MAVWDSFRNTWEVFPPIPDTGGTGSTITTKDEGVVLSTIVTTLNFAGAGVTASGAGAETLVTIPGGGTLTTQEEGTPVSTTVTTMNFVGTPITVTGGGATATVTVTPPYLVVSPAYAATVTTDLTGTSMYSHIIVNIGALTGNITYNITNGTVGQLIRVRFLQDGTGSRLLTLGANILVSADLPTSTLSTGINKIDMLGFHCHDSTHYYMVAVNRGF